ncbi:GntR family transcriptional regulator [Caballeronia temeraria]|uniref:GntR family transcriptional regulator n=1 Tax=Caballeronia temeraria TaxID=1777137 RepID=A0A158DIW4_9BURK|nr:FadR/GntR family transcriptional regulator [Caballeronia temeraria]SAK94592.1 GntR family transcriptional regulator [Caballeronia temeraria]
MNDRTELGLIDVPKSCDMLAARLRNQILSGNLIAGQQLPSERDLMEQTGISRNAVREALRILETEGLVTTKLGRYGGSFVCQPTDEMFARYLTIFSRSHSIPLKSLVQARQALEPQVALLATINRTEEDLSELSAAIKQLEKTEDPASFLDMNIRCHLLIAKASGNQLLQVFLSSLSGLIRDVAGEMEDVMVSSVRKDVLRFHQQIFDAIKRQDTEAAVRRMTRHIQAYEQRLATVLTDDKSKVSA